MHVYLLGALWVVGAALVAGAIAIANFRLSSPEQRDTENETPAHVFSMVAGLSAVILAFVLISLFDGVGSARETSYREANSLESVYWAGDALPEPTRDQIKVLSRSYATTVSKEEWPKMRAGEPIGKHGWDTLGQLRAAINQATVKGDWEGGRKAEAADRMRDVYEARQERLAAAGRGLSPVVWFALILGGVISVLFVNLFRKPRLAPHLIVVVTFAAVITLMLYAVYQMENPFGRGVELGPDAFTSALARFG